MADLVEYSRWICDPQVMRFVGFPRAKSLREARSILRPIIRQARRPNRRNFFLAIRLKQHDVYVGDTGLTILKQGRTGGVAELGYFLLPEHQGHGYASEAAAALVSFAFNTLCCHRVIAKCDADNIASAKVMARAGLEHEATHRNHRYREGEWRDELVFAAHKPQLNSGTEPRTLPA